MIKQYNDLLYNQLFTEILNIYLCKSEKEIFILSIPKKISEGYFQRIFQYFAANKKSLFLEIGCNTFFKNSFRLCASEEFENE